MKDMKALGNNFIVTGGRLHKTRMNRALKIGVGPSKIRIYINRMPNRFDDISDNHVVICVASSRDDISNACGIIYDGMTVEVRGNDPSVVYPSIILVVSKRVLGDLVNSVSLNRRFKVIDIDNESVG